MSNEGIVPERGELASAGSSDVREYQVTWTVTLRAGCADEAASLARYLQANPASPMSVFQVTDPSGNAEWVNLQQGGYLH